MPPANDSLHTELLRGTLDMLVLKTLSIGPMHGYGIAKHLEQVSREAFRIEQGSLYPSLQRMLQQGWVKAGGVARRTTRAPAFTPSRSRDANSSASKSPGLRRRSRPSGLVMRQGPRLPGSPARLGRRGRLADELDRELRFHQSMLEREYRERGLSLADAAPRGVSWKLDRDSRRESRHVELSPGLKIRSSTSATASVRCAARQG